MFSYSMIKLDGELEMASIVKFHDNHLFRMLSEKYEELSHDKNVDQTTRSLFLFVYWFLINKMHVLSIVDSGNTYLGMDRAPIYKINFPNRVILFHNQHNLMDLDRAYSFEGFKQAELILSWFRITIKSFYIKSWDQQLLNRWLQQNPDAHTTNLYSEADFEKSVISQGKVYAKQPQKHKVLTRFLHLFNKPGETGEESNDMKKLEKYAGKQKEKQSQDPEGDK